MDYELWTSIYLSDTTASAEEVNLNAPHSPHPNAIEAFNHVLHQIKHEIVQSRHQWDKHEPKMWSRAVGLSDAELTHFAIEQDLVQVCSGLVSYGTIILGKIRIPAVNDALGRGYIHVRCVDQLLIGRCLPPACLPTYGRLPIGVGAFGRVRKMMT
ncbi:hypothetical protein J3R82DRAFT_10425 [Butyriboletus roseoflavus]|nr:hypothetical protein J3R82DRAFT_10425 [Butyriboletus roseoflavus]